MLNQRSANKAKGALGLCFWKRNFPSPKMISYHSLDRTIWSPALTWALYLTKHQEKGCGTPPYIPPSLAPASDPGEFITSVRTLMVPMQVGGLGARRGWYDDQKW